MSIHPPLPFGAAIGDDEIWRQTLNRAMGPGRRPALFLDRDGVVVDEVNYLHRVEDVRLVDGVWEIISKANALSLAVVIVTNQAGIGRGHFGWEEFVAVQEAIIDGLAGQGAFVNAVYACPHHAEGKPPHDVADHEYRKPNPGMLLRAARDLPISLADSWIVGDRAGDIEAGRNAGLAGGLHILSGHGADDGERSAALALEASAFSVRTGDTIAAAADLPLLG